MNKSTDRAIVVVINGGFIKHLTALVHSININWSNHPDIYVFINKETVDSLQLKMLQTLGVRVMPFHPQDSIFRNSLIDSEKPFCSKEYHDTGYFFLNFWNNELLANKNLLILDADMIVLKPLDSFFENNVFTAVSDASDRYLPVFNIMGQSLIKLSKYFKAILYSIINKVPIKPHLSINGGVIYLPLDNRNKESFALMMNMLRLFKPYCMSEQELILLWMLKKGFPVSQDFRFNFQARFFNGMQQKNISDRWLDKIRSSVDDIHIMHFTGPKPDAPQFLIHDWTKGRTELIELYNGYRSKVLSA